MDKDVKELQNRRIVMNKLEMAIIEAVDKLCTESNYEITYNEINASLVNILRSNLSQEYSIKK